MQAARMRWPSCNLFNPVSPHYIGHQGWTWYTVLSCISCKLLPTILGKNNHTPTHPGTHADTHTHTSCGENKRHNGISINDYLQLSLYLYIHIHIYRYWRFPFFDGIFHHKSTVFGEFGVPPINKSYLFQRKLQRQAIALWSWSAPKTRPWFRRTSTVTMRRPGGPGNPGFTRPGKTKSTIEAMAPVEIVDLPS